MAVVNSLLHSGVNIDGATRAAAPQGPEAFRGPCRKVIFFAALLM